MTNARGARVGLAIILAPWLAAALVAAGYLAAQALASPCPCGTDTECMEMHGGDGGPEDSPLFTKTPTLES